MQKKLLFIPVMTLITQTALATTPFKPYVDLTINTQWSNQTNQQEPQDLVAKSAESGVKNFTLAFITDAGSCQPAWGSQQMYAVSANWGAHLTDAMREAGIQYTIAFGGATGDDMSKACDDNALFNVYEKVLSTYQPQGLDFDIENGSADVAKTMRVLSKLQASHPHLPISFTLPVLPEGLTAEGIRVVKAAHDNGLTFTVNIMAMDYGPAYNGNMGDYAIQAATSLFAQIKQIAPEKNDTTIWNMIEITPMIGVNDVNIEEFKLADADKLRQFANTKHLNAISMWSFFRDMPCDSKWASPICSGNNLQQKPYEYSARFNGN
jgi:chitinase